MVVSRGFGRWRAAAGLAVLTVALAGCGNAPNTSNSPKDDALPSSVATSKDFDPNANFTYALSVLTTTWDPTQSTVAYELETMKPVYDRLLRQLPDGSFEPMLATEYTPAEDGKSLTLKLRENLKFTDGTPFNADAVKFNLDRARAQGSKIASELSMVTNVEVIDENTVKIDISGWLGSLPAALSARPGVMVSPAAAESGELATKPVGIGPYVLESFTPGDRAVMKRSENYWDKDAQRVATFTVRLIADDQTRLNALKSGDIDGMTARPDQVPTLQNSDLNVISAPSSWFIYLGVNTATAPFDKVEVRKALSQALDRDSIAQGLYDGYCTPQIMPFVKGTVAYSDKVGDGLDKFPYDPKSAQKVLKDSGATEGSFDMASLNVTIYTKLSEIVQEELKAVGMTTSVSTAPATELYQKFSIEKTSPMISVVYAASADPSALLQRTVAPNALLNPGKLPNNEIMKYAAEAAATLDKTTAKAAYEKMADAWVENPPNIIPICNVYQMAALSKNVTGVMQTAQGDADLREVAIKKK